jgi:hypothetical protein
MCGGYDVANGGIPNFFKHVRATQSDQVVNAPRSGEIGRTEGSGVRKAKESFENDVMANLDDCMASGRAKIVMGDWEMTCLGAIRDCHLCCGNDARYVQTSCKEICRPVMMR